MNDHQQHAETLSGAVAKLTPPTGVIVASAAGWTLQDWVWLLTIVYLVLMSAKLLWDWIAPQFRKRDR